MADKKIWLVLGVIIGFILAVIYLLSTTQGLPKTSNKKEESTPRPSSDESVQLITIIGKEYSFEPAALTVSSGQKVKIIFKNQGFSLHNLVIDGVNVTSKTIGPGEEDILEFTAPATGIYEIYCSLGNHEEMGMKGQLEVR